MFIPSQKEKAITKITLFEKFLIFISSNWMIKQNEKLFTQKKRIKNCYQKKKEWKMKVVGPCWWA